MNKLLVRLNILRVTMSSSMLSVPMSVIFELSVLTPVRESPSIDIATTLPPPSISTTPFVPQQTTTLIPTPPITTDAPIINTAKIDLSAEALAALKTQVPSIVDNYLGSKVGDVFQKELKKHTADLIQKYTLQQIPEYLADHRLHHALIEALIEDENAMDKGVADIVQDHKRNHDDDEDDDDEDPLAGPNQGNQTKRRRTKDSESFKKPSTTKETPKGKSSYKGSKTGKSALAEEPVEEPIAEVVMDDAGDDVFHDDDQPQDASEPKTTKTPNPDWFTQPPRPPTPDPEWNKHLVVLDQSEQSWFIKMVSTIKDPLTFDDLMDTMIDFCKYVLNRLKIDNLTQDILLGPAYNLLKGMCSSSIELEYHF
ncbi:hypothetical protein Tco_0906623 [Tanacetum coccineum]|uniref:Uncharacterized protein n=1 Tax=Tanacetum coccineum TaxID=301880 RepID=A0ABQ5CHZ2_9ASTR